MKKTESEITKIKNKRIVLAVFFLLPTVLFTWGLYFRWTGNAQTTKVLGTITTICVIIAVLLLYTTNDDYIRQRLEDKYAIEKHHKFTFKEQWFKYVPPDIVKVGLMGIFCAILIGVSRLLSESEILGSAENTNAITPLLISLGLVIYAIWMAYCNEFSTKKGLIKFVLIALVAYAFAFYLIFSVQMG